ncbi:PREDICTED: glucose-6-phosphate isomerase, cytosolic 2B-like isoform X2 [Populus euphratica]|uniref:Glucose-6-phosphate isomerase, cytosolic 2B-like isoform X2 n=1 Tax=Populus euphratica TaxID=75702 RepID=A0AAJ6T8N4_POPEU|nr:PREDICTED: glucose-6-phosphate isomerase, cytosolic 2B-like isoform X2 [Populus euphratica]
MFGEKFGIDPINAFAFWDWVGGRFSVCSVVGVLPLSLQYGFSIAGKFLKGAQSIDQHSYSAPFEKNLPPGKIEFGEPGANGRHSFYQLIHQILQDILCWLNLTSVVTHLS